MSLAFLVTVNADSHGGDQKPTLYRPGGEGPAGPPSMSRPLPPQNMTGGKNASDCPPRTGREWVCMVSYITSRATS